MINMENYLYDKISNLFDTWDEDGIYAVSFYVDANSANRYRGYANLPSLSVSYNTEDDCAHAPADSERRWNYAFWRQDEATIFCCQTDPEDYDLLLDWLLQQGVDDPGKDGPEGDPSGFCLLTEVLGRVARRFYDEGYFVKKLSRTVPILIHRLEYSFDCTTRATAHANPGGEAEDFLTYDWETYWGDEDDDEDEEAQQLKEFRDNLSKANDSLLELFSQGGDVQQILAGERLREIVSGLGILPKNDD